ncbi:MAG: DUF1844 domain-containing protein [Phycisphaerae bacterium]|jgi:hypothetical protein|nr:DUF1844 domain-containing protein [Phycisphaerae bacterium]MCZ2398762.1 DUF1844 domain-containing protein [Phycisphaerae bacterium]
MSDAERKIIVDDDWKAQAQREKERLAQEVQERPALPDPSFAEIVNIIAMQALVGLGMMAGAGGERIPADLPVAKHFIDLLQTLDDKTRSNLTAEEKSLIDQVLYELRMRFVQAAGGGAERGPAIAP